MFVCISEKPILIYYIIWQKQKEEMPCIYFLGAGLGLE